MIVATPEVPGIDKITGNAVDYLMLVKTKPGSQVAVRRELQRRIKASFEKNEHRTRRSQPRDCCRHSKIELGAAA